MAVGQKQVKNTVCELTLNTRCLGAWHEKMYEEVQSGLAIYAARGLRSGTVEITAVAFTACGGWRFFGRKMRCGNWTSSRWFQM